MYATSRAALLSKHLQRLVPYTQTNRPITSKKVSKKMILVSLAGNDQLAEPNVTSLRT